MKKLERFNPGKFLVIVLLVFLIPLAYYFCFWVPRQKVDLSKKYLRVIAKMSNQFETKWQNIMMVFENEIRNILKKNETMNRLKSQLENNKTNSFWQHYGYEAQYNKLKDEISAKQLFPSLVKTLNRIPGMEVECTKTQSLELAEIFDINTLLNNLQIKFVGELSHLTFEITIKSMPNNKTTGNKLEFPYKIKASININDYVKNIFTEPEFEDLFILDNNKNVIFRWREQIKEGIKHHLRILNFEEIISTSTSLLNSKNSLSKPKSQNGEKGKYAISYTRALDITIAGSNYILFIQPLSLKLFNSDSDEKWAIGGLIPRKVFNQRSLKISNNILLLFVLLLALAVVAFPFFRILVLDPHERLRIRDISFLFLGLIFGVPLMVYFFIFSSIYLINKDTHSNLTHLYDQINDNFQIEIKSAYKQLDIISQEKETLLKMEYEKDEAKGKEILKALKREKKLEYPFFDMAFIMNKNGKQIYKGVTNLDKISFNDVSNREYFSRVKEGEYWYIKIEDKKKKKKEKPMMLDLVYSKSTGQYEINLCYPLAMGQKEEAFAAGMSFRPLSLINPVFPHGYAFVIVDEKGKVLFHSDSRLSFYENFFVECDDSSILRAAIKTKAECETKITYQNRRWDLFLKPMENIPWNIIVLRDKDVKSSINLLTVFLAGMKYILYIFTLIIIFLGSLLNYFFKKKIRGQSPGGCFFSFRWMWPDNKLHATYVNIAGLNIVLFVFSLFYLIVNQIQSKYFLVIPFIVLMFTYNLLRKIPVNNKKYLSPIIISLLVIILALVTNQPIISYNNIFLVILISFIFYFFLIYYPKKIGNEIQRRGWIRHKAFSLFLFSFVLLIFVYPTFFFFKSSYIDMTEIASKRDQLSLASQYFKWDRHFKNNYKEHYRFRDTYKTDDTVNLLKNLWCYHIPTNSEFNRFEDLIRQESTFLFQVYPVKDNLSLANRLPLYLPTKSIFHIKKMSTIPKITLKLLNLINNLTPTSTFYYEELIYLLPDYFVGKKDKEEQDIPLQWVKKYENRVKKIYFCYHDKSDTQKPVFIVSQFSKLGFNIRNISILSALIVIIFLFLSLLLFPAVLLVIKVVFPINIEFISAKEPVISSVDKIDKEPGNFFILGLSKPEEILLSKENDKYHVIDCKKIDITQEFVNKFSPKQKGKVRIYNFEYNRFSFEANRIKLHLLEKLVFSCHVDIMVVSSFEPIENFVLTNSQDKERRHKNNQAGNNFNPEGEIIETRWQRVLDQFDFKYYVKEPKNKSDSKTKDGKVEAFIEKECSGVYLRRIKGKILEELKGKTTKNLDIALVKERISELAKPTYISIWNTCSRDEKLVLIQLVQERLVNFKNKTIVRFLLKKELIKGPVLRIMNKTFKEFINNIDDLESILALEKKLEEGKLKKFQRPFFLAITVAILFLLFTEPETLNSWMVLLPVITGGLPELFRLFDFMFHGKRSTFEV